MATAGDERDVAGFAAIGTVVETVHAQTDVHLSLANSAVPFAFAAIFRQIALRTNGGSLHRSLSRKLYLSGGRAARRSWAAVGELLTSPEGNSSLTAGNGSVSDNPTHQELPGNFAG